MQVLLLAEGNQWPQSLSLPTGVDISWKVASRQRVRWVVLHACMCNVNVLKEIHIENVD